MNHQPFIRCVEHSDTAVILIHGIAGTPLHFRDLLPLIPAEWSVYNLLLDGHGGSVKDFAASSMEKWRSQVSSVVETVLKTHSRMLIIAHSMGTLFSIQEAIKHQPAVKGLFLINCPLRVHYPPSTALLSVRAAKGISMDPAVVAMRNASSVKLTPYLRHYIGWIPRILELLREIRKTRDLLPQLQVTTKCFHSAGDELVSGRSCREFPRSKMISAVTLKDSGHFAYSQEDTLILQRSLQDTIDSILEKPA